jgi:hypothetical protein
MRDAVAATGHPVTEMGGNHAVVHGYLSTLKHLHRQGRLLLEECLPYYAAWKGQFEVLQWLHANWCPWDEETSLAAARRGHLELLKWAIAKGCPWHPRVRSHAEERGHLELVNWAIANGCA